VIVIFAHYGGIDEIGIFVLPALIAIFALRWAEKKAKRAAAEKEVAEKEAAEDQAVGSDVD
jgi:hypothetical protein